MAKIALRELRGTRGQGWCCGWAPWPFRCPARSQKSRADHVKPSRSSRTPWNWRRRWSLYKDARVRHAQPRNLFMKWAPGAKLRSLIADIDNRRIASRSRNNKAALPSLAIIAQSEQNPPRLCVKIPDLQNLLWCVALVQHAFRYSPRARQCSERSWAP